MRIVLHHGIDVVDLEAFKRALSLGRAHIIDRCFTAVERTVGSTSADPDAFFASRFAVKEALMKALGTGFAGGVAFSDIEVTTLETGQPVVSVCGTTREIADHHGIDDFSVSISHTENIIVASVIAVGHRA